jgi:hypothetical protein
MHIENFYKQLVFTKNFIVAMFSVNCIMSDNQSLFTLKVKILSFGC